MNFVERDARFRHLGLKVSVFSLLAILSLFALLYMVALSQGYFVPKVVIGFEADTGSDLRVGMPVKLSAFKIGEVSKVELNQRARVDVTMRIDEPYMHWIRTDSVASLEKEGLIGDSFVTIRAGSPTMPPLPPKGRVKFQYGRGIADIAQDVRNRVVPVIDEVQSTLHYLNDPAGDVHQSLHELRQFSQELRTTRKQLDRLLVHVDTVTDQQLKGALVDLDRTLHSANVAVDKVNQSLPPLLEHGDVALQSVNKAANEAADTAATANNLLKQSGPKVDKTLEDTDRLMLDSRKLIDRVSLPWPLRTHGKGESTGQP